MELALLYPGERVVMDKKANAVIKPDDYHLRPVFSALMWTVGMEGKEALGGHLALTNYRFFFNTHSLNRVRGSFSIYLPSIRSIANTSAGIKRQLTIQTNSQSVTFVLWGIPRLMAATREARASLTPQDIVRLADTVFRDPAKSGAGLEVLKGLNAAALAADAALLAPALGAQTVKVAGLSAAIALLDLATVTADSPTEVDGERADRNWADT